MRSAAAGMTALLVSAALARAWSHLRKPARRKESSPAEGAVERRAARRLHESALVLACSVCADSALEHYRGSFHNPVMRIAPSAAAVVAFSNLRALRASRRRAALGSGAAELALTIGLVGTGFHLYNLRARPGGLRSDDRVRFGTLFYGAPLAAPMALSLAGVFELAARRISTLGTRPTARVALGRALLACTSVALLGTTAEVGELHFRGAFQNPFMYLPVTLPPAAAAALAVRSIVPSALSNHVTRSLLIATGALGIAGIGFHGYGLQRNMGGLRNWRQTLLAGPPLPAPPAFTGIALAGLGILGLLEEST